MRTAAVANYRELEVSEEYNGVCAHWIAKGIGDGFIRVPGARDIFVSGKDLENADCLQRGDTFTSKCGCTERED